MALRTIDSTATRTGGRDGVGANSPAEAADADFIASELNWAIWATVFACACLAIAAGCAFYAYKESSWLGVYAALVAFVLTLPAAFTAARSRANIIQVFRS